MGTAGQLPETYYIVIRQNIYADGNDAEYVEVRNREELAALIACDPYIMGVIEHAMGDIHFIDTEWLMNAYPQFWDGEGT